MLANKNKLLDVKIIKKRYLEEKRFVEVAVLVADDLVFLSKRLFVVGSEGVEEAAEIERVAREREDLDWELRWL